MNNNDLNLLSEEADMRIGDISPDNDPSATTEAVEGEATTLSDGMYRYSVTTTTTTGPTEGEAITPTPPGDSSSTTTTTGPTEGEAITPTPPGDSSSTTTTGPVDGEATTPTTPPGDSSSTTTTTQPGDGEHVEEDEPNKSVTFTTEAPEITTSDLKENEVVDPIDVYLGAHTISNTLLALFDGMGVRVTAHYNSTRLASGTMGIGWYHNFDKKITEAENGKLWVYPNPTAYSEYEATDETGTEYRCSRPEKTGYVLTVSNAGTYKYALDYNHEKTELYDANGRLASVVTHDGFVTEVTYAEGLITVTDTTTQKKLYLEMNAEGLICRVYDDAQRQAVLTYANNMLTSIQDANGHALTYTYDEVGRVLSGTDALGIRYFTNEYDAYGRVASQKDGIAGSRRTYLTYEGNTRRVTDRNGKVSTREYDENGMLLCYADAIGHTKYYEYDSRFRIIKETDERGNSIIREYGAWKNPIAITDKNGNRTTFTYDDRGNLTDITYPTTSAGTATEHFTYNARNQMLTHTDVKGTVTTYTYDANGMPTSKKVGEKPAVTFTYQMGNLIATTDAMGNTTSYAYNALGQRVSVTDANAKTTTYTYDVCGNLLTATDALGNTVSYTYDANHQKTAEVDANGNRTEYTYNGNMKNTMVRYPDGNTVSYLYDGEDRVTKTVDRGGNITTMDYDSAGRLSYQHHADGGTVSYTYDVAGNVIKETNPNGGSTSMTYDANGNVLTVTDHAGNVTRCQYNEMGKPVRRVNAASGTTLYTYSTAGELLCETDALGGNTTYTYDAYGKCVSVTDARGNTTSYTYDANGNLLCVTDALGNVTTYTYDALNRVASVKDANDHTVTYGYDACGRRTTVTDARGNVFTTTYDANGNVLKTLDAKGNTVSETTYNALNLPLTIANAMGQVTTYTYNSLGKVASITDAMNHTSEFVYDVMGRNTLVHDANDGQSSMTFDLLGNVTRREDPLGGGTSYTYDKMGRCTEESTASNGTVSCTYNELSLQKEKTNARGQKRKYFYDAKGRITGYTSPEDAVSYLYDANDNVLCVTDRYGTVTREFDALNRVTKYTDTFGKSIEYVYDNVGNLTEVKYPDGSIVVYTYDANNNLTSVTDWANRVTTYTYDVNNRVVGVTKPDGSVTTTVYDNMQRVTSTVEKTANGTVITGFEYSYDTLSRIVEETHLDKNTKFCYTYDVLGRVVSRVEKYLSNNSTGHSESFTYDDAGNITKARYSSYSYGANNTMTLDSGYAVMYDADGNMIYRMGDGYSYDSANRLTNAPGHTYNYNAENVRIRDLANNGNETTYTYDTVTKLSRLLLRTKNGAVTKYVYGLGLIGEESDGVFKTYHFDSRGSTIAVTDMNGIVTDTFLYDTYGRCLDRSGMSDIIFGYNGRDGVITEDNGLIYMRARYYSPEMRRFINADIVAGDISNAITLNRFAYANGNPVSFVDPFGLAADERGDNSSEHTSIREFVESRGGTATWNALLGIAKFELNGKSLYTDRFGLNIIGIDVYNDDGSMIAADYDLAYYFEVEDWATYFPDFEWYDGSEGQEGVEGFGVRTTKHFLSKDFCLDYADNIIKMAGTDGEYLGQNRLGIAQECYAHAVIYLWTEVSTTLIDRGYRYKASAEEIGYIENDPYRLRYSVIWFLGDSINPKANSSPFNI